MATMEISPPAKKARVVEASGYKGFGSFHSENVEELIRQPRSVYQPPGVPFPTRCREKGVPAFGKDMRSSFLLDDSWTFLNHGAFGAPLRPSFDFAQQWRLYSEKQPLRFMDRELLPQMVRSIRELAEFIRAPPQELVLLPNATMGLNAVIASINLKPGDVIYTLDIGYGSVRTMVERVCADAAGRHVEAVVDVSKLESEEDLVELVAGTLPENTRLAVFDHISSNTALLLPVERLTAIAKQRGSLVLIDGAHAIGQVDIDVCAIGADFYVGNCHKWLCNTRGCGFMHVKAELQSLLTPRVISHGFGSGFTSNFIWDGNRFALEKLVEAKINKSSTNPLLSCCFVLESICKREANKPETKQF